MVDFKYNEMKTEQLDFSKICRVCCQEGGVMSIFKVHISRKLMACTSVQVKEAFFVFIFRIIFKFWILGFFQVWRNDGLPGQICTRCVSKLHIAFQFKKLCEKSDIQLRNQLKLMSTKVPPEPEDIKVPAPPPCENNYVYVECTSTPVPVQEIRTFDSIPSAQQQIHHQVNYNSCQSLNHLQPAIANGYTIQNLPATVHFQAYNVPIQMPVSNQIITPVTQLTAGKKFSDFL